MFLLQCLKCLMLLTTSSPRLTLVGENSERLGDQAKVLDNLMIVIRQAQESMNSRHINWCRDLLQSVHLSLLHVKTS